MAVAFYHQWPAGAAAKAGEVSEKIGEHLQGQPPSGGIYHAEGPTADGGYWAFDVWESAESYETFRQQILQPALESVSAPSGESQQLEVQWDSSQMRGQS